MQENSKQNHKFVVQNKTRVMRLPATGNKMLMCVDEVKTLKRISRREEEIVRLLYVAFLIDWEEEKPHRHWVGQRAEDYKITNYFESSLQCNVGKTPIIKLEMSEQCVSCGDKLLTAPCFCEV